MHLLIYAVIQSANQVAAALGITSGRSKSEASLNVHIKYQNGGKCALTVVWLLCFSAKCFINRFREKFHIQQFLEFIQSGAKT